MPGFAPYPKAPHPHKTRPCLLENSPCNGPMSFSPLGVCGVAIHQNICRSCLPPIPGPFIGLCSLPPNHPRITGPIGHHSRAFSGRHATVGVVFPAIELFNDSGYPGPEPSILPCCHGVRALRGPLFLWLGFKVLFRCGKRSFLVFVVLSIANGPNQRENELWGHLGESRDGC